MQNSLIQDVDTGEVVHSEDVDMSSDDQKHLDATEEVAEEAASGEEESKGSRQVATNRNAGEPPRKSSEKLSGRQNRLNKVLREST